MRRITILVLVLAFCLSLGQHTAQATEGGSSYYFPGSSATFGVAIPPEHGFMMADQLIYFNGSASRAVLRGHVDIDLKSSALYNYVSGFYTFKKPVFGGRLQIGTAASVGGVDVKVGASSTHHSASVSESSTNFGDMMTSAALYWKKGPVSYKLVQSVFLPTGGYTKGHLANVGRNYWAFDTSLAMTWMNKKGTEISVMPGILFNSKNPATDYKSGTEFHVDIAVNQFLKKNLAVGLHGYYYSQLSGDSGSGALLGHFKGQSLGVGPAMLWVPKSGKGHLSVVAKWMHDVHAKHRMRGDYAQLTVAYKF